jgi:tRNA U34 5-methylaminomethyl-2-thiouridine-forming methyltransferase MnmC
MEVDREGQGLKENRAEQVSVALRVQESGTHVAHEFVFLHSYIPRIKLNVRPV